MTASTRRAAIGAMLAAPLATVPAVAAADPPVCERETAFLALLPRLVPLARALSEARAMATRLHDEGDAAAGEHPGWEDRDAAQAWAERARVARQAAGYSAAWAAWNRADKALTPLVEGFDDVPMRTLPAVMLKVLLSDLDERWGESALADLRCVAEAGLWV